MVWADGRNFDGYGARVVSDETLTKQYTSVVTTTGELNVFSRNRTSNTWTSFAISGANRTALALPFENDGHNTTCVAIDGIGRLHLWANYHNDPFTRYLRTATPSGGSFADIITLVPATMNDVEVRNSYINPIKLSDGRLLMFARSGPTGSGSGVANLNYWSMPANGSAWSSRKLWLRGIPPGDPGSADLATNHSPYPSFSLEDNHPSGPRLHATWIWRNYGTVSRSNTLPSYAYLDITNDVWYTISGVPITLPIDISNTDVQTGMVAGAEGYINGGGLALDTSGYPNYCLSQTPSYHIRWNGSAWQQTTIPTTLNGAAPSSRLSAHRINGRIHWLATSGVNSRIILFDKDGLYKVYLGPGVNGSGVIATAIDQVDNADPTVLRKLGVLEVMTPSDDLPFIASFGNKVKVK